MGVEIRPRPVDAVPQLPQRDARARRRAASELGVTVYENGQAPLVVPFAPSAEVPPVAVVVPPEVTTTATSPETTAGQFVAGHATPPSRSRRGKRSARQAKE